MNIKEIIERKKSELAAAERSAEYNEEQRQRYYEKCDFYYDQREKAKDVYHQIKEEIEALEAADAVLNREALPSLTNDLVQRPISPAPKRTTPPKPDFNPDSYFE